MTDEFLEPPYILLIIKTGEELLAVSRSNGDKRLYEFPMSVIGEGESPVTAAVRRLRQLIGEREVRVSPLVELRPVVAPRCTGHVFLATCDRGVSADGMYRFAVDVWELMIREKQVTALETLGAWGFYAARRNGSG